MDPTAPANVVAAVSSAPPSGHLGGTLNGRFDFHECGPGSAAGDFCLTDNVSGRLAPLGTVVGRFEVVIHFGQATGDCAPITKTGQFTNRHGGLKIAAVGTYCATPAIAAYVITSANGTGWLANHTGTGTWVVPAPTNATSTGGNGPETITTTLTRAN